jgi:hypothetical protein
MEQTSYNVPYTRAWCIYHLSITHQNLEQTKHVKYFVLYVRVHKLPGQPDAQYLCTLALCIELYIKDSQTRIFIAKFNVYLYNRGWISKPMTQYTILPLLGAVSELRKATIRFVMSARKEQSGSTGRIFMKFYIWVLGFWFLCSLRPYSTDCH